MAAPKTVSLNQFNATVKTAVQAAVKKHPKFKKAEEVNGIAFSYLIRGFPILDEVLKEVSVGETQAFANEVAARITVGPAGAATELVTKGSGGSMIYTGGHLIIGIVLDPFVLEQ